MSKRDSSGDKDDDDRKKPLKQTIGTKRKAKPEPTPVAERKVDDSDAAVRTPAAKRAKPNEEDNNDADGDAKDSDSPLSTSTSAMHTSPETDVEVSRPPPMRASAMHQVLSNSDVHSTQANASSASSNASDSSSTAGASPVDLSRLDNRANPPFALDPLQADKAMHAVSAMIAATEKKPAMQQPPFDKGGAPPPPPPKAAPLGGTNIIQGTVEVIDLVGFRPLSPPLWCCRLVGLVLLF